MTRLARLLPWLAIQTRLVQCFTVALLLHVAGICILGTIKLVARIIPRPFTCTFPPPEPPVNLPPGDGGGDQSAPTTGLPTVPTIPVPTRPPLSEPRPLIGIDDLYGRPAGTSPLVKFDPPSATLPGGPIGPDFKSHTGGSKNPFYDSRFKPKIGDCRVVFKAGIFCS